MKSLKERNHILNKSLKIINFIIPNTIWSASNCSAFEMSLELSQNHFVLLGNVETERYLPWQRVIISWPKGNIEASLSIRKTSEIEAYSRRNGFYIKSHSHLLRLFLKAFLLIVRTKHIVTYSN